RLILIGRLDARIHGLAGRAAALEELAARSGRILVDVDRVVVERDDRGVGREHADVQVRRDRVVEPADRAVQLRRAVSDEVPDEAGPRGPLLGEGERLEGSGDRVEAVVVLAVVAETG